jgi:tRNA pseudouridine55 synthase
MSALMPITDASGADTQAPFRGQQPARRTASVRPPPIPRKALHGVLLLDKPVGWTSNDLLQKVKGLMRAQKAGHTGTLDPLATGLLPLCLGAATKFSQVSLDADKHYRATLRLGQRTSTGDREGSVEQERPVLTSRAAIEAACARLTGLLDQLPPMHSALKHQGKALYEYARAGVDIERSTRQVHIHAIDIIEWQHEALVIDVHCSKGTYIRTLAQDLGELLGCGAHLQALQRTGCGELRLDQAVTLEALTAMTPEQREALLLPIDALLAGWPAVQLAQEDAGRFLCGLRRRVAAPDQPQVRVYGPPPTPVAAATETRASAHRAFLGTAHISAGELIADRLLSPIEVQVTP